MNNPKRSTNMEIASLCFGILSTVSCVCLYLSIPCAALAILFGVLSRGGNMQFEQKALAGIILRSFGLAFTILLYGFSFAFAIYEYGSIENFLKSYSEMYQLDYNELLDQLTSTEYGLFRL